MKAQIKQKVNNTIIREAFVRSIPITGSYLFVGMAYGIMMQEAGFDWFWSALTSVAVYTGAFQFVLVTFLSGGASLITIGITALFMNSRQFFYGLTFVEDFRKMGKRFPYMVNTLTDETYAVNCSMLEPQGTGDDEHRRNVMFYVALFSKSSWVLASILGGVLGQLIPFELKGIDFCMTALFITIFIDQWRSYRTHLPAILGAGCGLCMLLLVGPDRFMLPSLILVSGLLLLFEKRISGSEKEVAEK